MSCSFVKNTVPPSRTGLMSTLERIGDLSLQAPSSRQDVPRFYEDLVRNQPHDAVSLSEPERQILDLYDSLKEIELERSLLEAQKTVQPVSLDALPQSDDLDDQVRKAENELLKAKATYSLRNQIIENVLMTDPILKAVHSGEQATTAERTLSTLINRRDVLSMAHTNISSDLKSTLDSLLEAETENRIAMKKNQELAGTLLSLAEESKADDRDEFTSPELQRQLDGLEEEIKVARSKWMILKSVISAVVAGSGVDWARDERLRELVVDDGDGEPVMDV